LQLIAHKGPRGGVLEVSIDSRTMPDITLHSERDQYGAMIPVATGLPNGTHQVRMVTQSERGAQVDIDGLIVRQSPHAWLSYIVVIAAAAVAIGALFARHRERGQPGPTAIRS